MANTRKKRARALSAKTGMSHQAAVNTLAKAARVGPTYAELCVSTIEKISTLLLGPDERCEVEHLPKILEERLSLKAPPRESKRPRLLEIDDDDLVVTIRHIDKPATANEPAFKGTKLRVYVDRWQLGLISRLDLRSSGDMKHPEVDIEIAGGVRQDQPAWPEGTLLRDIIGPLLKFPFVKVTSPFGVEGRSSPSLTRSFDSTG